MCKSDLLKKITITFILLTVMPILLLSQAVDDDQKTERIPAWPAFESAYLINGQSVTMHSARTFEFAIQHRFGKVNSGSFDLLGLYAPSNVRLGLNYYFTDRILLGIGSTKFHMIQDLNWKWLIFQQSRDEVIPLSIAYAGNTGISVRDNPDFYPDVSNRLSYFHELMFARRFSDLFSLQLSGSIAHFNVVEEGFKNDHISIAARTRLGITPALSVLLEFDQPISSHDAASPEPNLGFGIEYATRGHQFQVFMSNYDALMGQRNTLYNRNDLTDFDFLIGFNIIRRWNL